MQRPRTHTDLQWPLRHTGLPATPLNTRTQRWAGMGGCSDSSLSSQWLTRLDPYTSVLLMLVREEEAGPAPVQLFHIFSLSLRYFSSRTLFFTN